MTALKEFSRSFSFYMRHYPRLMLATIAGAFILSLLEMVSATMLLPLFSASVNVETTAPLIGHVETILEMFSLPNGFYYLFTIFVGAYVLKIIADLFIGIFVENCQFIIARDFRKHAIQGIKKVSWPYFTEHSHGQIVNAMVQEITKASGLFNLLRVIITSIILLFIYILLGVSVSFELLTIAAFLTIFGIFVARPMFQMARKAGAGKVERLRDLSGELMQGILSYKTFKAMAREDQLMEKLFVANTDHLKADLLNVKAKKYLNASQEFLLVIAGVAGVVFARDFLGIGLAEIGFMAIIMLRMNTHTKTLLQKFQALTQNAYVLDKYREFSQTLEDYAEQHHGSSPPTLPAAITFKDVSFSHGSNLILDNVNFQIKATGLTLIFGPSGTGKTTIIDLVCGFYKPTSGEIYIGQDPLSEINIQSLRKAIGYAAQDTYLLNQSLAYNIAAFDDEIDANAIKKSIEQAGLKDFLQTKNNDLNFIVGEGGAQLSGGERQRIGLARALAKKPQILILDEPTSALDQATEDEIITTINNIAKDIPVIVISHQPAFKAVADQVILLGESDKA